MPPLEGANRKKNLPNLSAAPSSHIGSSDATPSSLLRVLTDFMKLYTEKPRLTMNISVPEATRNK